MIFIWSLLVLFSWASECENCFNVEDLIKLSLEKSQEIQASDAATESLKYRAKNAGLWENPKLFYGQGERSEVQQSKSRVAEFGVEQNIPLWGQKSAARRAAEGEFKASVYKKLNTKQKVVYEVSRLSFEAASLIEEREYMSERRKRLQLIRQYLKSRTFKAPSKITEALLLRNRLTIIETEYEHVELNLKETLEHLNIFTKLPTPPQPKVEWLESLPPPPDAATFFSKATTNLQVQSLKSTIDAAQGELSVAKKSQLPEINLGFSGFKESAGAEENYNKITLGLTIPIGGLIGDNIQSAKSRINESEALYRLAQDESKAEIAKALLRIDEARKRMERFPLSIRKELEQELSQTEVEYKRGLIETLLFIELENQTHEQIKNIYSAQNDFMREMSYLTFITKDGQHVE